MATTSAFQVDPATSVAWDCVIPVQCFLSDDVCPAEPRPPPCHFMVPRQGYLFLSMKVIQEMFKPFLSKSDEPWFECIVPEPSSISGRNQPMILTRVDPNAKRFVVPWHLPMGVILDLIAAQQNRKVDIYSTLPLDLILHIGNAPESVMALSLHQVEKFGLVMLNQSIKSSTAIVYGSVKPFVEEPPDLNAALRQALLNNDVRAVFAWRSQFKKKNAKANLQSPEVPATSLVPTKFYYEGKSATRAIDPERYPTVGFVLRRYLYCCNDLKDERCMASEVLRDRAFVTISGAEPFLCTPMEFLGEHLCSYDGYVHLVVVPRVSNEPCEPSEAYKAWEAKLDQAQREDAQWGDSRSRGKSLFAAVRASVMLSGSSRSFLSEADAVRESPTTKEENREGSPKDSSPTSSSSPQQPPNGQHVQQPEVASEPHEAAQPLPQETPSQPQPEVPPKQAGPQPTAATQDEEKTAKDS